VATRFAEFSILLIQCYTTCRVFLRRRLNSQRRHCISIRWHWCLLQTTQPQSLFTICSQRRSPVLYCNYHHKSIVIHTGWPKKVSHHQFFKKSY